MDSNHERVAELLPDYAVGALGDVETRLVATHLERCADCRAELVWVLELAGLLSAVPPPGPDVKAGLMRRAAARERPTPPRIVAAVPASTPPGASSGSRRGSPWAWQFPKTAFAAGLAALFLVAATVGWGVLTRDGPNESERIALLVSGAGAAHPLTDSELTIPATGIVYAAPDRDEAFLVAQGLPALNADQRYQVWLFTDRGERVSGGLFTPNPDGVGQLLIRAPAQFATYWAVGISTEPTAGSASPTSPLILGGWVQ